MPALVHVTDPLVTERLLLRPYEPGDLDALHDMQSRPEVARYLYWEPRTRSESQSSLVRKVGWTRIWGEGDTLNLAVTRRSGGPVIGDVLVTYTSAAHQQAELGYLFHPGVHGQGLATEAAAVMVDLAFDQLGVHRVFARLDARNLPSARLLERLGLQREAHLVQNEWVKGEWVDEVIYAVRADEWVAVRSAGGGVGQRGRTASR
jgi:RimJ/RimL family protein N-acetyltransferase